MDARKRDYASIPATRAAPAPQDEAAPAAAGARAWHRWTCRH